MHVVLYVPPQFNNTALKAPIIQCKYFPLPNQKQCLSPAGSFLYPMNNIDQGRVGWGVTGSQFCSMGILWVRNCQTLFKHLFVQKCRYKNTTLLSVFSASWRDCCSFRHMRSLVVLAILLRGDSIFSQNSDTFKKLYTMYSKTYHASFKLTQSWKKCMMNRFLAETVTYRVPRHINIQNNIKCWWLKWPTQLFIHAARKCQGNFNNLVQLQPKLIYTMVCFQWFIDNFVK